MYKFEEVFFDDRVTVILELLKLILIIFFIGHWIACFFFAVGFWKLDSTYETWINEENIIDG